MTRATVLMRSGALPGAAAGLAGGLAFGAAMAQVGVLATVGSVVRGGPVAVGLAVQLVTAAILGMGFGMLVVRQRQRAGETVYWGLSYGAFWWFLGPLTLVPITRGEPVSWDLPAAQAQVPSLIGHLIYGAATALTLVALRAGRGVSRCAVTPRVLTRGAIAGVAVSAVLGAVLAPRLEPTAALSMLSAGGRTAALLALGALAGLGYAPLSARPGEGAGPALVRGTVYGFAWWVLAGLILLPVLDGAGLDWSLSATRAALATFPGYLLLGAGTAMAFRWLSSLLRALFVNDLRRLNEEGAGARGLRVGGRGALSGLVGGLLFTLVMLRIGFLTTVAHLVGTDSVLTGFLVHLLIAQAIGISYGVLFGRRSYDLASALGWGLSYGFFWWILGDLTLLPVLLGVPPQWDAGDLAAAFPALVAHLAYGAGLGVTYHRLEIRTRFWWITRNEVETARLALQREETLGSAPALWALVVVIALMVAVLVGG